MNNQTKFCNKCNQTKSLSSFGKDSRNKDGLQGICEACRKISKQLGRDKRAAEGPLITSSFKTCNKCSTTKKGRDFYRDNGISDGLSTICKSCKDESSGKWKENNREAYNANMREWRANNKEEVKNIDLNRNYGISLEKFNEMLTAQSGVCATCSKPPRGVRPLCVDHDHNTGKVRGLLCYGCNRLMVLVDNPELLSRALAYKKAP